MQVVLAVLRALGLVVDFQSAVGLVVHGRCMGLHRVVVLVGRQVRGIHLHRRFGKLPGEVATRRRCFGGGGMRFLACAQVCLVGLLGIVDFDQRACIAGQFQGFGDH
ncbi:hypothetical protein D3C76_1277630 [compost metagenome]